MSASYSVAEAKNRLPEILRLVENGTHVHITRRGRPVAVLVSEQALAGFSRGRGATLAEALAAFSRVVPTEDCFDDDFFLGLRERSPGREVRR